MRDGLPVYACRLADCDKMNAWIADCLSSGSGSAFSIGGAAASAVDRSLAGPMPPCTKFAEVSLAYTEVLQLQVLIHSPYLHLLLLSVYLSVKCQMFAARIFIMIMYNVCAAVLCCRLAPKTRLSFSRARSMRLTSIWLTCASGERL